MAIAQATLQKIATLLKINVTDLVNAQKAEVDTELKLPDNLTVLTAEELTARDQNNQSIGINSKKDEFITAGKEIAVKDIKAKFGITDASKDLTVVLEKVNAKITADDAAQGQINALIKKNTDLEKQVGKLEKQVTDATDMKGRLGKLPKNLNTDVLTIDEHLDLISKNVVKTAEGFAIDGVVLRDTTTQAALGEEAAIKHFYEQKRPALLVKEGAAGGTGGAGGGGRGGRGGSDDGGSGAGTYKTLGQYRDAWEKRNPGKNSLGEEFQRELKVYIKEHPDLEMVDE